MAVMLLQAKPFISEAHVFNDAGLSFDVWPPKPNHMHRSHASGSTDDMTKDESPNITAVLSAAASEADKTGQPGADKLLPLPGSCQADSSSSSAESSQFRSCPSDAATASASEPSHDSVIIDSNPDGSASAVSHDSVVIDTVPDTEVELPRGFHLAVKLWQEAVATYATAQHSTDSASIK